MPSQNTDIRARSEWLWWHHSRSPRGPRRPYYRPSLEPLESRELLSVGAAPTLPDPLAGQVEMVQPGFVAPNDFTSAGDTLYFMGGGGLWRSDGTASTSQVAGRDQGLFDVVDLTAVGNTVFFAGANGRGAWNLWESDGTTAGTRIVKEIRPGFSSNPTELTDVGGTLYFSAVGDDGQMGLWRSDGTAGGTVLVTTLNGFAQIADVNGKAFFIVNDQVWTTDGTAAGTTLVASIPIDFGPSAGYVGVLVPFGNQLVFTVSDNSGEYWLWVSDGTAAGTHTLLGYNDPYTGFRATARDFAQAGGVLYFGASAAGTSGLWRTDGTAAGTQLVSPAYTGDSTEVVAVDSQVFFSDANDSLWTSDGTAVGTRLVRTFADGYSPGTYDLVNGNGVLYFVAIDTDTTHSSQLWRSDGTAAGTVPVGGQVNPTTPNGPSWDGRWPSELTVVGDSLLFTAGLTVSDDEIYKVDLAPDADAGGPYTVSAGGTVQLHADCRDPMPDSLTYAWDLNGDGVYGEIGLLATRGDEVGPSPVFDAAGLAPGTTVTVWLRVTDAAGLSTYSQATITVTSGDGTQSGLTVGVQASVSVQASATLAGTSAAASSSAALALDATAPTPDDLAVLLMGWVAAQRTKNQV